jgi:hypothetical protein
MTTYSACRRYLNESYTQKMKINTSMKIWEEINLTGRIDKQMRRRKESNITKTTKWQKLIKIFQ